MQRLHFKGQVLLHNLDLQQGSIPFVLACTVTRLLLGTVVSGPHRAGPPTAPKAVQRSFISAACVVDMIVDMQWLSTWALQAAALLLLMPERQMASYVQNSVCGMD